MSWDAGGSGSWGAMKDWNSGNSAWGASTTAPAPKTTVSIAKNGFDNSTSTNAFGNTNTFGAKDMDEPSKMATKDLGSGSGSGFDTNGGDFGNGGDIGAGGGDNGGCFRCGELG